MSNLWGKKNDNWFRLSAGILFQIFAVEAQQGINRDA